MDQCVHLALAHADQVVRVLVALVVRVLVVLVAVSVVLGLAVLVAVSVVLGLVVLAAHLVVLGLVVLAAHLVVAETVNAVRQKRSHVHVVVKTSTKCCHRQPRRIHKATHQFLKVLSLSNADHRRKSLHRS